MAPSTPARAVPVDLAPWFDGGDAAKDAVAAAIDEACSTSGFLALTGHGVPAELMERMLDVSSAFFDLPVEEKLRYHLDDAAANRGYAPFESEALSYSLGVDSDPDLFEAFNIGRELVPDGIDATAATTYFSPNVWPEAPADMRATYLAYWDACEELGRTLCEVFARALALPEGFFEPFLTRTPSVMRVNNYERRPEHGTPKPDQLRMGAHSDYGSLTVLLADSVPGFQIQDEAGEFHDILPPEGGFLVNLGDLLAEWTNDRWRSTVHRVVPPPADQPGAFRRRSVAWFQQPNHDAVIEVLDVCCDDDNPPRYPPTTSGEHLMAKLMGPRAGHEVDVDAAFLASAD
ncbi:MAG: 2-oxoglutarate and iron-dependent oxygenase domain-containing protein [Actinomycetota bacterium]